MITEAFDFNNNIDTSKLEMPEHINDAISLRILKQVYEAILIEKDGIFGKNTSNKIIKIEDDKIIFKTEERQLSYNFTIQYQAANKNFHFDVNRIIGTDSTYTWHHNFPGSTPSASNILIWIFLIANLIKHIIEINDITISYELNPEVCYIFPQSYKKTYDSEKEYIITKSLIKSFPVLKLHNNQALIRLERLIFEDADTIDYFIDSIYNDNSDKIRIAVKSPALKTEPMYGGFMGRRNPGTTGRYMRKSIQRYSHNILKEAFDFDNNIENTDTELHINTDEVFQPKYHKANILYLKTVSAFLYDLLGIKYNLGYNNMVNFMSKMPLTMGIQYIKEADNSIILCIPYPTSTRYSNEQMNAISKYINDSVNFYSYNELSLPKNIKDFVKSEIKSLSKNFGILFVDTYVSKDNSLILLNCFRNLGVSTDNAYFIVIATDYMDFGNLDNCPPLTKPLFEGLDFNNNVNNASSEIISDNELNSYLLQKNLKANKDYFEKEKSCIDVLINNYKLDAFAVYNTLLSAAFTSLNSAFDIYDTANTVSLVYDIDKKLDTKEFAEAYNEFCKELDKSNLFYCYNSYKEVPDNIKQFLINDCIDNSENLIYTFLKLYVAKDSGLLIMIYKDYMKAKYKNDFSPTYIVPIFTNAVNVTKPEHKIANYFNSFSLNEAFDFNNIESTTNIIIGDEVLQLANTNDNINYLKKYRNIEAGMLSLLSSYYNYYNWKMPNLDSYESKATYEKKNLMLVIDWKHENTFTTPPIIKALLHCTPYHKEWNDLITFITNIVGDNNITEIYMSSDQGLIITEEQIENAYSINYYYKIILTGAVNYNKPNQKPIKLLNHILHINEAFDFENEINTDNTLSEIDKLAQLAVKKQNLEHNKSLMNMVFLFKNILGDIYHIDENEPKTIHYFIKNNKLKFFDQSKHALVYKINYLEKNALSKSIFKQTVNVVIAQNQNFTHIESYLHKQYNDIIEYIKTILNKDSYALINDVYISTDNGLILLHTYYGWFVIITNCIDYSAYKQNETILPLIAQ